jgi:hypothetical protein
MNIVNIGWKVVINLVEILLNDISRGKDDSRHNYRKPGYSGIIALIKAYITKEGYTLVDSKLTLYKEYYCLFYIDFVY